MPMCRGFMVASLLNVAGCLMVTPLDDVVPLAGADESLALGQGEPGALGQEGVMPLANASAGSTAGEPPLLPDDATGSDGGAGVMTTGYECDPIQQWWGTGSPYIATFQRLTGSCANLPALPFVAGPEGNSSCEMTSRALSGCGYEEEEVCAEPGITQRATLTLRQLAPEGPIDGTLDLKIDADEGSCASQYGVVVTPQPVPYVCDPLADLDGTFRSVIEIHENSCGVSPATGGQRTVSWRNTSTWLDPGCSLIMEFVEPLGCSYAATFSCAGSEGELVVSQELPGGVITAHWAIEQLDDSCGCFCVLDYAIEYYPL